MSPEVAAAAERLGPLAIAGALAAAAAGCLFWVQRHSAPFSWPETPSPHFAFEYLLLLGVLLVGADLAYVESQFTPLGDAWPWHLLKTRRGTGHWRRPRRWPRARARERRRPTTARWLPAAAASAAAAPRVSTSRRLRSPFRPECAARAAERLPCRLAADSFRRETLMTTSAERSAPHPGYTLSKCVRRLKSR